MTTSTSLPASPGRPVSRARLAGGCLLAVLGAVPAAVVLLPDLLGLDQSNPFAQLVAFRTHLLAAGVVALVMLLLVCRMRSGAWPVAAGVAGVLVIGTALVVPRVIADPPPTGGRPLTVLAFNTFEGDADEVALAELIRTQRPDLIAMPEAGASIRARLSPLIEPLGYRMHISAAADPRDVANTGLAVSDRLGPVSVTGSGPASPVPHVEATGGSLGDLRFVAYHAAAPVPRDVRQWRSDLAALANWCAATTPAVIAGDLNATLDHSALRAGMAGCADAADQRGDGLTPTWSPSTRTRPIGPQIDHVLMTSGIAAETFTIQELPGSDHSAILTRLRLQTPLPTPLPTH